MYGNDPYDELEEEWSWDTIETDSAYYDSDDQKGNPMSQNQKRKNLKSQKTMLHNLCKFYQSTLQNF